MTENAVNRTAEWKSNDHRHYMHPFTDHKGLGEKGGSRIMARADSVYIYDSEGTQILDGMAGLWCMNLGYGRQELVGAIEIVCGLAGINLVGMDIVEVAPAYDVGEITALAGTTQACEFLCLYATNQRRQE